MYRAIKTRIIPVTCWTSPHLASPPHHLPYLNLHHLFLIPHLNLPHLTSPVLPSQPSLPFPHSFSHLPYLRLPHLFTFLFLTYLNLRRILAIIFVVFLTSTFVICSPLFSSLCLSQLSSYLSLPSPKISSYLHLRSPR